MTPEEARAFTASYVPTPKDFARVGAILAAQTRLDLQALRVCYKHLVEDQDGGAFFRAIVAMAETVVQKLGLREHPEAMEAPLSDIINYHRQAIDNEGTLKMISNRGFDPNSELVQAHILGTGLGPNDSQIDDDAMGPVNVQLPTPELRADRSDGRRCRGFRLTDLQ